MVPSVRAKCHVVWVEKEQRDPASGKEDNIIFFSIAGSEELEEFIGKLEACMSDILSHEREMAGTKLQSAKEELIVAKQRVVELQTRIQQLEIQLHTPAQTQLVGAA